MQRPRALLLDDDGELDRFAQALRRVGLEPLRRSGADVTDGLPMPSALLITSGKRALQLPSLAVLGAGGAPTWLCVHTQDFHPLRKRLRNLGVHYLVQATVDDRTLDVFLGQLLHSGSDRRRVPRLPVGCEIRWQWKSGQPEKGQLLDLSEQGARILLGPELPQGAVLAIQLPSQLTASPLELVGRVQRCEPSYQAETIQHRAVLTFDELDAEARALIGALVRGERIGTRVTPLAPRPYVDGTGIPDWEELQESGDRRRLPRRAYRAHVDAFSTGEQAAPIAALGRDLSIAGIRIDDDPHLELGTRLTLALHGGPREEPLLVEACVSRRDADGTLALAFQDLAAEQRRALDSMLAILPPVATLDGVDGRIVPTEIRRR